MRLVCDGEPVPRRLVAGLAARAARRIAAAGLGPGHAIEVPGVGGVATVAAVEAADATGVAACFATEVATAARPAAPLASARLVEAGHELELVRLRDDPVPFLPAAVGAIFSTSGSEGEPQRVLLSRDGLAYQAHATAARLELGAGDGLLVPLPLSHAYGFGLLAIARTLGASLFLEPATGLAGAVERVLDRRATTIDAVPTMYMRMLARARASESFRVALARLRVRGCGGDVLPPSLADDFAAVVGAPLHDGYGLTEAGPNVALSGPAPGDQRPGTVGRPLSGTEVRIDAAGEVLVRSPSVMIGYADAEEATRATLDAAGWLHTGDIGALDRDGHLRIAGRRKHALKVHGSTYPPTLIEDVLCALRDVDEAVVLGIPSGDRRGDRIVAFIAAPGGAAGRALASRAAAACASELPARLRPHEIRVVAELPRLAAGKPDRRALQRLAHAGPTTGGAG